MKALVTADIHGLYTGWKELLKQLGPADLLVVAGDLLGEKYPSNEADYQPEKIKHELAQLPNTKYLVLGNCDLNSSFPTASKELEFKLFGKKLFLTHGDSPLTIPEAICRNRQIDIHISGHTHCFGLRKYQDCLVLNPGSPTKSRAVQHTYATIESIKENIHCQIINIFSGEVISTLRL